MMAALALLPKTQNNSFAPGQSVLIVSLEYSSTHSYSILILDGSHIKIARLKLTFIF